MTAANWGELAGIIVTALATYLAHCRIGRHLGGPPHK